MLAPSSVPALRTGLGYQLLGIWTKQSTFRVPQHLQPEPEAY